MDGLDVPLLQRMRRLERREYDRMIAAGLFDGERVELLHGVIVRMSPQDALHSDPIQQLTKKFVRAFGDRADVRVQLPLALTDHDEPEPDLAIVEARHYLDEHPRTAFLVVEVANTSVDADRSKSAIYASAGIAEYWLVDLPRRCVERYSKPDGDLYTEMTTHGRAETIHPLAFPDVAIPLAEILPPSR